MGFSMAISDPKNVSKILDPRAYPESALHFLEYFHIRPGQPDVPYLTRIIERFSELPYENISKIIKLSHSWDSPEKIRLPETVIDEHVSSRLGGTCFSLTFFFTDHLNVSTLYLLSGDVPHERRPKRALQYGRAD